MKKSLGYFRASAYKAPMRCLYGMLSSRSGGTPSSSLMVSEEGSQGTVTFCAARESVSSRKDTERIAPLLHHALALFVTRAQNALSVLQNAGGPQNGSAMNALFRGQFSGKAT